MVLFHVSIHTGITRLDSDSFHLIQTLLWKIQVQSSTININIFCQFAPEMFPWLYEMLQMIGMSGECLVGRVLNRLDWCESFNPMFCIKCRLIRQWIDGRNVPACSVIYGHRLISGPKEFIYLILTPTATYLTHLTSNEISKVLRLQPLPSFDFDWHLKHE